MQALHAKNEQQIDHLWFHWYLATLQRPNLTQQSLDSIISAIESCMNQLAQRLFPWERVEAGRDVAIKSLREQWVAAYGDPEDPEVQKKIAATVAALRSQDKSRS